MGERDVGEGWGKAGSLASGSLTAVSNMAHVPAPLDGPLWVGSSCSVLPFEKGKTLVLSDILWITDSTTVQIIVNIAIVSNVTT
jgi:hypothetical protein